MSEAQSSRPERRRTARRLLAAIVAGGLSAVAWARPGTAQEFQNKGFYQSYVFGAPDDPSGDWLLAFGGRLYDMWWAVLFTDPPEGDHPAYPNRARASGAETWRCVTWHSWDYKGRDGAFGTGRHFTGIEGIDRMTGANPAVFAGIIRDDTRGYSEDLIPEGALRALALFVSKGQIDTDRVIDRVTRRVRGDSAYGRKMFQNVCAICHDYNGMAWISGDDEGHDTLGAITAANPWRGLHKAMNGQTYADMPATRVFGLQVCSMFSPTPRRFRGNDGPRSLAWPALL